MKNYAIHLKRVRDRLRLRSEPYWQQVPSYKGLSMGYRKAPSGVESWHCRILSGGARFESLGPVASMTYEEATRRALEWAKGPRPSAETPSTVAEAADRYVEHVKCNKGEEPAKEARQRINRTITQDPIGVIKLKDLSQDHLESWQSRHSEGRDADTVNRDYRILRAVLNRALDHKWIASKEAWQKVKPLRGKPRSKRIRPRVLSVNEQRQLLTACDDDLAPLVKALFITGCRPIELRRVTRSDLKNSKLRVHSYKGYNGEPRERYFPLTAKQNEFFEEIAQSKQPDDPLFLRADGTPWDKRSLNTKFRKAREQAGLPDQDKVQPYSARRTVITRFISNGVDLAKCEEIFGSDVDNLSKDYHDALPTTEQLERLAVDL